MNEHAASFADSWHRNAVEQVVRSLEAAFNAHDPDALAACYSENTVWTNAMGRRLLGRAAVAEFGHSVISRLKDSYARYEIASIVALRPDLLAVGVDQTPTDADGIAIDGGRGAALYVIGLEIDGWRIVAGQNTIVAS